MVNSVHDHLEIKTTENKGRGVFATADIADGAVLVVEKPLAHINIKMDFDGLPEEEVRK